MASIALFSVFLVTSHLMLHSLAQEQSGDTSCDPFLCGKLREVRFPYKNRTMQSACGFYTVDCENSQHPKIQFKEGGHWFEVLNISQAGTVTVNDTELQKELDSRKCKSLESFGLPAPLWYTNVSSPKIVSLFKCNRTSLPINITSPTSDFHNTTCGDYNLYYSTPTDQLFNITSFSNNIPKDCSFIQLPAADNHNAPNPNDFFSFFSSNFLLEVHIDYVCLECQRQNSSCHYDSEKKQNYCAPEPPKAPIEPTAPKGNRSFFAKNRRTVSIAAACAGLIVLVVLLCCLIRKFSLNKYIFFWKKPNEAHQNVEALLRMHGPLPTGRYSYLDVKKITNSFTSKIGQGGYGSVYKGKLQNGCSVAVKVLNKSKGNGEEFINEVVTIGRTSHVNIVALLGFCFEGSKRALIYEFMPNGSLEKFIFKESHNLKESHQLEWGTLYGISLGIARGLEYLHRGCNTRILHFDIKPHNILLDKDFSPKISDFGLAKVCTREKSIISMLEARGTVGYIAPEVFCRSFGGVSPKSDVYSYGMMVLEMVGGRNNVNDGADRTSEIYFPHWIYKRLELDDELGLKRIPNEEDNTKVRKMVITGLWCIQTDPSKRPTMSKVIEMLEGSVDSLQVPPKPFLSSPPRSPTDSSNSLLHAWIHGSNVAST